MNLRIRRPLYISFKSWLCCCSLPSVAPQQLFCLETLATILNSVVILKPSSPVSWNKCFVQSTDFHWWSNRTVGESPTLTWIRIHFMPGLYGETWNVASRGITRPPESTLDETALYTFPFKTWRFVYLRNKRHSWLVRRVTRLVGSSF